MVAILNADKHTYSTHKEYAVSCGGNLPSILNDFENKLIGGVSTDSFWLGSRQPASCTSEPSGCWDWSDGSGSINGYTNFDSGEPNDYNANEDCLQLVAWKNDVWNDNKCSNRFQGAYLLPLDFYRIKTCIFYKEIDKCRRGRRYLQIDINADNKGEDISVSMRRMMSNKSWHKRKSINRLGVTSNSLTTFSRCIDNNKCYKIMIKDEEKNGICCDDGEGSWSVRLDDDTINTSSFEDGRKEIVMINCDDME